MTLHRKRKLGREVLQLQSISRQSRSYVPPAARHCITHEDICSWTVAAYSFSFCKLAYSEEGLSDTHSVQLWVADQVCVCVCVGVWVDVGGWVRVCACVRPTHSNFNCNGTFFFSSTGLDLSSQWQASSQRSLVAYCCTISVPARILLHKETNP